MEYPDFELYYIDIKYVRELKNRLGKEGEHIYSVSPQEGKSLRPILGIIVLYNNKKYCIPLTSARNKPKITSMKNRIDFTKIIVEDKVVAGINYCDMLPIEDRQLRKIDLRIKSRDTKGTIQNKLQLKDELDWCNKNKRIIWDKAKVLYDKYISGEEFGRKRDCVDFIKAEKICKEYNKKIEDRRNCIAKNKNNLFS